MDFPLSELPEGTLSPYVCRIKDLYCPMDAAYAGAAERHGFKCSGCSESCCEERFFHHTLAEHLYLTEGMGSLDTDTVAGILDRAEEAMGRYRKTIADMVIDISNAMDKTHPRILL